MRKFLRVEQWDPALPEAPAPLAVFTVEEIGPTPEVVITDENEVVRVHVESMGLALSLLAAELV